MVVIIMCVYRLHPWFFSSCPYPAKLRTFARVPPWIEFPLRHRPGRRVRVRETFPRGRNDEDLVALANFHTIHPNGRLKRIPPLLGGQNMCTARLDRDVSKSHALTETSTFARYPNNSQYPIRHFFSHYWARKARRTHTTQCAIPTCCC